MVARLRVWLVWWQNAYHARVGTPLRPVPTEPFSPRPDAWMDHADWQAVSAGHAVNTP